MPREIYNWSYRDVTRFLQENGFIFHKFLAGSHEAWIKRGEAEEQDRTVEMNLTRSSYPPGTLMTIIGQSRIPKDEWIRWSRS